MGFLTFMKKWRQLQDKQRKLHKHRTVNKSIKYRANIGHSIRSIHRALHRAIHRESIGQGELPDGLLEEGATILVKHKAHSSNRARTGQNRPEQA